MGLFYDMKSTQLIFVYTVLTEIIAMMLYMKMNNAIKRGN